MLKKLKILEISALDGIGDARCNFWVSPMGKMMGFRLFSVLATGAVALGMGAGNAHAASITFSGWETTTDNSVIDTAPTVVIDDAANPNVLTFTVSTPKANGELSGVWLQFVSGFSFVLGDVSILTSGVSIDAFESPADADIGNGRNLNGNFTPNTTPAGAFDLAFGFDDGESGGNGRQIDVPLSFTLDDKNGTLGLGDLERIGLRFQSVGTLGQDGLGGSSEKLIGTPPDTPAVPLPAAGWMLLAGLGSLAALRRRNKA